jgi:hypothetical protein
VVDVDEVSGWGFLGFGKAIRDLLYLGSSTQLQRCVMWVLKYFVYSSAVMFPSTSATYHFPPSHRTVARFRPSHLQTVQMKLEQATLSISDSKSLDRTDCLRHYALFM